MLLKKNRQEAGLTQRDAAARLLRPQSYLSKCESGERRVDVVELFEFCEAYGISPEKFVKRLASLPKTPSQPQP